MKFIRSLLSFTLFSLLYLTQWKKKIVVANVRYTYEELSPKSSNLFYKTLLRHLSIHVVEFLIYKKPIKKLPTSINSYPFYIDSLEFSIDSSSKRILEEMKKGGLFMTAHFGNYESIGPWLCKIGIPLQASYAPIKPHFLNRFLETKIRAIDGIYYSTFIENPKKILKLLDDGKLFCLIADQDYRKSKPIESHFLNKPVLCNPLPEFILKHRPQTPIYFCSIQEEGQKRILIAKKISPKNNTGIEVYSQFHLWLENLIHHKHFFWYGWTHRRFLGKNTKHSIYSQIINKIKN